jgi:hypothetical protein
MNMQKRYELEVTKDEIADKDLSETSPRMPGLLTEFLQNQRD